MKKMKFGHDPRKLAKKVMETHAPTFAKLAKVEASEKTALGQDLLQGMKEILDIQQIPEKTVIVETRTQVLKESRDKWARKHSKLSTRKTKKFVDELSESLNQQNERIHFLQHQNKLMLELSEKQSFDINALRMQKPKEIHTVTEKHIETLVKAKVPRMVWVFIGISLLTNMYLLIAK